MAANSDLKSRRKLHERLLKQRNIQLVRSSTPDPSLLSPNVSFDNMPATAELSDRFGRAMESLDLKGDSKKLLENYTDEQKWKLICSNDSIQAKHPVDYYISAMRERLLYYQSVIEGKKLKAKIFDSSILENLEISLRTNSVEWVVDFLSEKNSGLNLILDYLSCAIDSIRYDLNPYETLTSPLRGQQKVASRHSVSAISLNKSSGTPSKEKVDSDKNKYFNIPQSDIHSCVKCMKAIMNHAKGFELVFSHPKAINLLILSLRDNKIKTKVIALNLISVLCLVDKGHAKILKSFEYFKQIFYEEHRFSYLVELLAKTEDLYIELMTTCLRAINLIVHATPDMNFEVYLQQEFKQLDFENTLITLKALDIEMLNSQIDAYRVNLIDVGSLKSNAIGNGKGDVCRDQDLENKRVSRNVSNFSQSQNKENFEEIERLKLLINHLQDDRDALEKKCAKLQTQAAQISLSPSLSPSNSLKEELNPARSPMSHNTSTSTLSSATDSSYYSTQSTPQNTMGDDSNRLLNSSEELTPQATNDGGEFKVFDEGEKSVPSPPPMAPPAPPMAPPAPPLMPLAQVGQGLMIIGLNLPPKQIIKTKNRLPLLNWTPIPPSNVKQSIFNGMNEEHLYKIIDFGDLETKFQLADSSENPITNGRVTLRNFNFNLEMNNNTEALLDANKLRNIAIARRRIGINTKELISYIENLNYQKLTIDRVDIILRLLPSAEEEEKIKRIFEESQFNSGTTFSDDEKFIIDLIGVDNIGRKLKVMSFMGNFKDNLINFTSQLQCLMEASSSIKKSTRFKKIIEIILSFGNYLNSSKKGGAYGFKLQCLDLLNDTRSADKRWSLLHFLALTIQKKFPDLNNFVKDLNSVDKAAALSQENISTEINELKQSMILAKNELSQNRKSTLSEFVLHSESKLTKLVEELAKSQELHTSLALYFGESADRISLSVIFVTIGRFVKSYKLAQSELTTLTTEPSKYKTVRMQNANNIDPDQNILRKASTDKRLSQHEIGFGTVDNIIEGLKFEPYIR